MLANIFAIRMEHFPIISMNVKLKSQLVYFEILDKDINGVQCIVIYSLL